jgi:hypothetical protein
MSYAEQEAEGPRLEKRIAYLDACCASYRESLETIQRHCICTRNTGGFDYGETHPILKKPGPGKRWLIAFDIAEAVLKHDGGADLLEEFKALQVLEKVSRAFKSGFDRGFSNSSDTIHARDAIFEVLADLDDLRSRR